MKLKRCQDVLDMVFHDITIESWMNDSNIWGWHSITISFLSNSDFVERKTVKGFAIIQKPIIAFLCRKIFSQWLMV